MREEERVAMEPAESTQPKTRIASPAKALAKLSDKDYPSAGHLEKEDIVILILSIVLIIATLWLATTVL